MMLKLSVWHVNILWKFYQNIYNSTLCGFFWSLHSLSVMLMLWSLHRVLCSRAGFYVHFWHFVFIFCTFLLAPWFIYVADNWFCVFVPNLFCALHFYRVGVYVVAHQNMLNWLISVNIKRIYRVCMSVFLRKIKTLPEFSWSIWWKCV